MVVQMVGMTVDKKVDLSVMKTADWKVGLTDRKKVARKVVR